MQDDYHGAMENPTTVRKRTTIRIHEPLHRRAKARAAKEGLPLDSIISAALEAFLAWETITLETEIREGDRLRHREGARVERIGSVPGFGDRLGIDLEGGDEGDATPRRCFNGWERKR